MEKKEKRKLIDAKRLIEVLDKLDEVLNEEGLSQLEGEYVAEQFLKALEKEGNRLDAEADYKRHDFESMTT